MKESLGLKEATGMLNNGIADLLANPYIGYIGLNEEEMNEFYYIKQESDIAQAKARGDEYRQMVAEHRNSKGVTPITYDLIVNGLKFIAEHPSLDQHELVQGLLDLGYNFYTTDINNVFSKADANEMPLLFNGAKIIAEIRDSERVRNLYAKRFLIEDTYSSIFQLIRSITHDESYTKENLEKLSNARKMTP